MYGRPLYGSFGPQGKGVESGVRPTPSSYSFCFGSEGYLVEYVVLKRHLRFSGRQHFEWCTAEISL